MMGLSLGVLFGVVVFFSRCSVGVVIRVVLSLCQWESGALRKDILDILDLERFPQGKM